MKRLLLIALLFTGTPAAAQPDGEAIEVVVTCAALTLVAETEFGPNEDERVFWVLSAYKAYMDTATADDIIALVAESFMQSIYKGEFSWDEIEEGVNHCSLLMKEVLANHQD